MLRVIGCVLVLFGSAAWAAPSIDDPLRQALVRLLDANPAMDQMSVRQFEHAMPADQGYRDVGQAAVYAQEAGIAPELKALAAQARAELGEFANLARVLTALDVELPARLSLQQYKTLRDRHATLKAALDRCEEDPRPGRCGEENQAYMNALIADPLVMRPYFLLVAVRMALFPRDYLARRNVMVGTPLLLVVQERLACIAKGTDPCVFRGLASLNASIEEQVKGNIEDHRIAVEAGENDWPTDPATLAWVENQERDFVARINLQGRIDIIAHCGDDFRKRHGWAWIRDLYECLAEPGGKLLSANPAYMDPQRLGRAYETARQRRIERLAHARRATFGKRMRLLGIAVGLLAALGMIWAFARRFGGRAAVSVAVVIVTVGGALGATYAVRYAIEAAFEADTPARVNRAVFEVLTQDEMRAVVSRQTEGGLNLVAGPLFAISPLVEETARARFDVPLLAHLMASWARDAAPLAEQRVLDAARPKKGQPLPDIAAIQAKGEQAYTHVKAAAEKLAWIADGWRALQRIVGALPLLLMLVILWVFLRPMRAQLIALAETARTEGHADRLKALLGGELRSLLLFLPVLVLLLIAVGELMSLTLEPVVHLLILTSLKSVLHLTDGAASGAAVLGGLGALLLLVASGVLAYIAIFVIFTGKWREIVRARFHDGRAFAEQRWFFRQGLPGLIWTLAFPAAFSFGLLAVVRALAPTDQGWDQQGVTAGDLVLWPLIGFGAFWVLAWALRVFAVLGRLRRFDAAGG